MNLSLCMTRRALLALMVVSLPLAAFAADKAAGQDKAAETFLRSIYGNAYIGKNAKGVDIDKSAQLYRYFVPELAKQIDDDAKKAAKNGDVGELDGDPFIGAQDFEIHSFDVQVRNIGETTATGTITFSNLGTQRKILVSLKRLKVGWRIQDIDWGEGGKLSALYRPH
jgi:Protein of unknown function (DUF3828)